MSYAKAQAADLTRGALPVGGPYMQREEKEPGLDLRKIATILRRRNKIIWLTTLLFLFLTAAYLSITPPLYTANVQILFDPRAQKALDDDLAQEGLSPDGVDALIETQLSIIASEGVLRRVVLSENLGADPEFGRLGLTSRTLTWIANRFSTVPDDGMHANGRALQVLRRVVGAKRIKKTFVLDVFVSSEDKDKAARLADAVSLAYLRDQSAARAEAARNAGVALNARLNDLRLEVRKAERAVEEYKFQHNIVVVPGAPPNIANHETMIGLRELERNVDASRTVYLSFMNRARQANEQSNMDRVNARIISHAEPPLNRSWPPRVLLLCLALVGGLGCGCSIALARDTFDTRFYTKREIEEGTQFPVLAVVPRFLPVPLELPRDAGRAFFRLRDAIRQNQAGRANKVVMVTSCGVGDGKSTIASTLAATAAAEGERVLLLEGQYCSRVIWRRQKTCSQLDACCPIQHGGGAIIDSPISGELQSVVVPDLVLGGIESVREARTYLDDVCKLTSEHLKFDLVVLDCGSVHRDRLARHLAHVSDSIILVARAGRTRLEDVEDVAALLGAASERISGVVLNEVRSVT